MQTQPHISNKPKVQYQAMGKSASSSSMSALITSENLDAIMQRAREYADSGRYQEVHVMKSMVVFTVETKPTVTKYNVE